MNESGLYRTRASRELVLTQVIGNMIINDILQSQWPKAESVSTFVPESKERTSRKVLDMAQIPHSTGAGEAGDQRLRGLALRVSQGTADHHRESE